ADIGRDEVAVGVGLDEHRLRQGRRRAPDREATVAMVVVDHGRELPPAPKEGRRAVAGTLARLGQLEAEPPDAVDDLGLRHAGKASNRTRRTNAGWPGSTRA